MFAGGVVVLWTAPLLFHVAFEGRYDEGLAVLPWTMVYCVWYGLLLVAQNYIWCAERTKLGSLPLAVGLVANIAVNALLIPAFGLLGAVISTTLATGLALGVLYAINRMAGMQIQAGLIWLSLLPAAIGGGALCGTLALLVVLCILPFSKTLLNVQERGVIAEFYQKSLDWVAALRSGRLEQVEASHAV
jgi:O-antigen/teichoic acid export membrane protein